MAAVAAGGRVPETIDGSSVANVDCSKGVIAAAVQGPARSTSGLIKFLTYEQIKSLPTPRRATGRVCCVHLRRACVDQPGSRGPHSRAPADAEPLAIELLAYRQLEERLGRIAERVRGRSRRARPRPALSAYVCPPNNSRPILSPELHYFVTRTGWSTEQHRAWVSLLATDHLLR